MTFNTIYTLETPPRRLPSSHLSNSFLTPPYQMSIANSSFMSKLKSYSSSQPSLLSLHGKGDRLTSRIHLSAPLCTGQVTDEQTQVSDSKGHLFDRVPDSCKDTGTGQCRQGCGERKAYSRAWLILDTGIHAFYEPYS